MKERNKLKLSITEQLTSSNLQNDECKVKTASTIIKCFFPGAAKRDKRYYYTYQLSPYFFLKFYFKKQIHTGAEPPCALGGPWPLQNFFKPL